MTDLNFKAQAELLRTVSRRPSVNRAEAEQLQRVAATLLRLDRLRTGLVDMAAQPDPEATEEAEVLPDDLVSLLGLRRRS